MGSTTKGEGPGRQSEPFKSSTTNDSRQFTASVRNGKATCWLSRPAALWSRAASLFFPGVDDGGAPHYSYMDGAIAAAVVYDYRASLFSARGFPQITVAPGRHGETSVAFELRGVRLEFGVPTATLVRAALLFRRSGRHHPVVLKLVQDGLARLERMLTDGFAPRTMHRGAA